MALVINTNIQSMTSQNNLSKAQSEQSQAMDRLSSGKRINSAADDAAGLSISTKMSSQVKGLNQAMRNANDGISMMQTAEGALDQSQNILQRMRELAVQSANGTYQEGNRDTMNAEVEQLKAELDRIGESTSFNGLNLLNGEQDSVAIQVGANGGETISVGLTEVSTSTLGVGDTGGVSSQGTDAAIGEGDLKINGVDIGESKAEYDTASSTGNANSAIAKAAAINAHSDETGVTAQANENVVTGSSMTAGAATGSITLNGVEMAFSTDADASITRKSIVELINSNAGVTGVTAEDSGTDAGGVTLIAEDGRNIDIAFTTLTAANTGLAADDTYEAGVTLVADAGTSEIKIEGGDGTGTGDIADAGFREGTYKAGEVAVSSTQPASVDSGAADALADGDLVINGTNIGGARVSDDTKSAHKAGQSTDKAASGIATAAAINRHTDETGVTATVNATVADGAAATAGTAGETGELYLNGVQIDLTSQATAAENRDHAIEKINEKSAQTGVVATENDAGGITLTAADGRNISAVVDEGGAAGQATATNFGLGGIAGNETNATIPGADWEDHAITTYSSVTLTSASEIEVRAGANGDAGLAAAGLRAGDYGNGADGQYLKDIDISTASGATDAIAAIDNALDQVSAARSEFGAVQNRLDFTVDNLSNTVENTEAARSRIADADYAAESANLSRAQVLQQASQTMLAQANSAPQQVLSLLQ